MTKDLVDAKAVRKLIKNIDTMKGKGRGETLDIKDPKFMDKIMKQMIKQVVSNIEEGLNNKHYYNKGNKCQ